MKLQLEEEKPLTNLCFALKEGEYFKLGDSFITLRKVGYKGSYQILVQVNAPREVPISRQRRLEKSDAS